MGFLDKLSGKEKLGLFVGIVFLSLALLDRLIISPVNSKMQQMNQEIKIAEKQLGFDLRNLGQKEIVAREYKKLTQNIRKVGSDEEEVAKALAEIEELTRKSAIYVVDIKPQSPRSVDFYTEYSVEIEAEGQMESLINFLYELNNSSQLLRAEKLHFSLKEKDSPVIKASILITKILLP